MIIFIDESGIHKKVGHSTISFVYLQAKSIKEMEEAVVEVEKLLCIKPFHWSDYGSTNGWKKRASFLTVVSNLDFSFKLAIVNNPINYNIAFENIFQHLIIEHNIKKIIIDGKKSKRYEQKLKKVLRDKNISVKKIRLLRDEASAGLRLADAIAGLFRSHADNSTEQTIKLTKLFEKKITVQLVDGQMTR
ncbi:MAG: DUF3800 domain-containing protein [Candidatus Magasanikbacteria bacterium]